MNIKKEYLYIFGAFAIGSITGSVITWYVLKKKHEENLEHEIFETKLRFQKKNSNFPLDKDVNDDNYTYEYHYSENKNVEYDHATGNYIYHKEKPSMDEYMKSHFDEKALEEINNSYQKNIEIIHPREFGIIEDYDQIYLTYFDDGILIDEDENEILDVQYLIGDNFQKKFGMYGEDPDILTVRNDSLQAYYEVTRDHREYYRDILVKKYSTQDDED